MTYRTVTLVYQGLEDHPVFTLQQTKEQGDIWRHVMSTMDRQYYYAYCNRARIRTSKKLDVTIKENK